MHKKKAFWILLFAVVVAGGAFVRLRHLDERPMHTDESVHAEKFGALLEKGSYFYDPEEYHGPTLNYFTMVSAWLRGEKSYTAINEITLRLVPASFGILLLLAPLFFMRGLGIRAVFFCTVLLAFSPAFVYYSRYYIQEMLLVFFTGCFLGCLWNYTQRPKLLWMILTGVSAGLMHATKETFVFSILAAFTAVVFLTFTAGFRWHVKVLHLVTGLAAMAVTSMLFYSSFGSNPSGILDSVTTYLIWMKRAGGGSVHVHPWYYYLDLLTWMEFIEPITWNEDGIAGLALIGVFIAFSKKIGRRYRLGRFLTVYAIVLTVIYSVIPYKTPWSMMSFVYGMILVAGFTADRLIRSAWSRWSKGIIWIILAVYGFVSPAVQTWMLNFHYSSDPINPYVYAHTSDDIYKMVESVQAAAAASEQGEQTPVYVIAAGDDYWPFPWYLRSFSNVGYWNRVDDSVCGAPIIIAKAEHEQEILNVLYSVPEPGQRHLYVPLFDKRLYLRPGVEWRGYIRKDLWDMMSTGVEPIAQERKTGGILEAEPKKAEILNLVKFSHQVMHTDFQVFIQHDDGTYAGRAARAAFNEVDRLEGLLSRFVENSDVSRINGLKAGEETVVDQDTMGCLLAAKIAYQLTDGAFDITVGRLIQAWKDGDGQLAVKLLKERAAMDQLVLEEPFTVRKSADGIDVDLGGIGKGYAVDVIAQVLAERGIKKALIHGGASSVRIMAAPDGHDGWKIRLTHPVGGTQIALLTLANEVFSCSGIEQDGHIINPFSGQPVTDRKACWIRMKESAALADALSTAGMIMPMEQFEKIRTGVPDFAAMILMSGEESAGELIQIGEWSE